ncbi:MAG: hypothetical protein ACFNWU_08125, partial [Corynebacterium matruchotii]
VHASGLPGGTAATNDTPPASHRSLFSPRKQMCAASYIELYDAPAPAPSYPHRKVIHRPTPQAHQKHVSAPPVPVSTGGFPAAGGGTKAGVSLEA